MIRSLIISIVTLLLLSASVSAGMLAGLSKGTPDLKSATALAFGPEGVLFVADPAQGAVFAIGTGDIQATAKGVVKVEKIDEQIAGVLGTKGSDISINDLKVNPASGNVYFSVTRGKGSEAVPALVRLNRDGKLENIELKDILFAKVALPNANVKNRMEAITGMAFLEGRLFVAGLSNEEFASKLRAIPYPFTTADAGTSVEIYHGAHGKFETASPIRTFTPYTIDNKPHLLAAYTCTPLVKFPVDDLKPGAKIKGTTIAELGNRNRPLDIIPYSKAGKDYLLIANSARGVMQVDAGSIAQAEGIVTRVKDTAGLPYKTIAGLTDVVQLDKLDADHAVILKAPKGGPAILDTIELP